MCFAPVRRSVNLLRAATTRIDEHKFIEAERLIAAAKSNLTERLDLMVDGHPIGESIKEVEAQLIRARSGKNLRGNGIVNL